MRTSITRRSGRLSAQRRSGLAGTILIQALLLAVVVAVSYLLFRGVGIGRALAITHQGAASTGEARPPTITYREPGAGGSLISLELALQSAQQFVGRQDLALEGGLETSRSPQYGFAAYYLESAGGSGDQSFKVDARTGEVLEMSRLDWLAGGAAATRLGALEAESAAESFARGHFLGFAALNLVEQTMAPGPDGALLYTYKWALLAAESGAELPTSVSVSLASSSGEVVWYLAQREAATVSAQPAIGRDLAISTAAVLVDRAARWDARTPASVRLQIIFNAQNRQQLVWAITFPSRADVTAPGRPSLRLLIDAQTGESIANPA
jgi:hypothetical protein